MSSEQVCRLFFLEHLWVAIFSLVFLKAARPAGGSLSNLPGASSHFTVGQSDRGLQKVHVGIKVSIILR